MRRKPFSILVTGGSGFIGSEFVRQAVSSGHKVTVVDKLTYAGDRARLKSVTDQIRFHKFDVQQTERLEKVVAAEKPRIIVHFAAETHVDRSIQDVRPFIETNVKGTAAVIDVVRKYPVEKLIHVSTDEVYGEIKSGKFFEDSRLFPNNPYSATKAAADLLIKAAVRTWELPAVIVRPSNNYGPWQYPEKFVPVIIFKALNDEKIPVYGRGKNVREWLYVGDCARAILLLMEKGRTGEVYNVGSDAERENIATVKTLLRLLDKPSTLIQFVQDRPGHDFRYSLNCDKMKKLGWRPETSFEEGMKATIAWNFDNRRWVEGKTRFLQEYWKKVYKRIA